MNKVYFIKISDMVDIDKYNMFFSSVSEEKKEQINRFHFDMDKKLSLYSEILIRTIICKTLDIHNNEITFGKTEYGKPYLKTRSNFHFNISHTQNAIAVAVSGKPVGIDIEKIKSANLKIARRFFTESEVSYITKVKIENDMRFYEIWTKKESYIKYTGKGLSMLLNSFDVLDDNIAPKIQTIETSGYIISICSECADKKIKIIELSESNIESIAMILL